MTIVIKPVEKDNIKLTGIATKRFLAVWLLLCVPVSVVRAYYDIPEQPQTIFRQGERQSSSSAAVDAFVFYDYIDPALSGIVNVPPLKHYSKRFVPADTIPANQPIHMVPRRPIDPANEVANSLYANLKLKRLLEKYADIQKRARELLAGLGTPTTALENRSNTAGKPPSLHQLQENLKQKKLTVSRALPVIATGATPVTGAKTYGSGAPPATVMDSYRITDTSGAASEGVVGLSLGSAAVRGIGIENAATSLPWVIEVAFSIITYLQANKVETIIYGILLMTILMGASSLRQR